MMRMKLLNRNVNNLYFIGKVNCFGTFRIDFRKDKIFTYCCNQINRQKIYHYYLLIASQSPTTITFNVIVVQLESAGREVF